VDPLIFILAHTHQLVVRCEWDTYKYYIILYMTMVSLLFILVQKGVRDDNLILLIFNCMSSPVHILHENGDIN
jgi:hypothetical protein